MTTGWPSRTVSSTPANSPRTREASMVFMCTVRAQRTGVGGRPGGRCSLAEVRRSAVNASREYTLDGMGPPPSPRGRSDVAQDDAFCADGGDHLHVTAQRADVFAQRGDQVIAPPLDARELRLRDR